MAKLAEKVERVEDKMEERGITWTAIWRFLKDVILALLGLDLFF